MDSQIICGLDWVVAQVDDGVQIDAVNMSIAGPGEDGSCGSDPLHQAICDTVNAGIPVIVAAGNSHTDAADVAPAAFDQVITVSAFNDFNGAPGGGATKPVDCGSSSSTDDAFANYSNYGADVDIAAPGTCILSTPIGGGNPVYRSGTSMAAPHVTGAVALFKSVNHGASPAEVKNWLLNDASQPQGSSVGFTGDTDGIAEPVLAIGNISVPTPTPTLTPTQTAIPGQPYPIVGNSRSGGSLAATLAYDGNLSTWWKTAATSPPNSAWVLFDLGSEQTFNTIGWVFGEAGIAGSMRIQTSDDKSIWTTVGTFGGSPVGQWQSLTTFSSGRYIRFFFNNVSSTAQLGGLAEVQFWPPGSSPTATPTPTRTATATATQTPLPGSQIPIVGSGHSGSSSLGSVLYDKNPNTIWKTSAASAPNSAWVYIDLGGLKQISTVRWLFGETGIADSWRLQHRPINRPGSPVTRRATLPVGQWQQQSMSYNVRYIRFSLTIQVETVNSADSPKSRSGRAVRHRPPCRPLRRLRRRVRPRHQRRSARCIQ